MQTSDKQLLVVDDDHFICRYIEDVAAEEGIVAHCTATATEFLRAFEERQPDILMVDLMLPGTDGVELLQKVAGFGRKVSVILISGLDTRNLEAAERVDDQRFFLIDKLRHWDSGGQVSVRSGDSSASGVEIERVARADVDCRSRRLRLAGRGQGHEPVALQVEVQPGLVAQVLGAQNTGLLAFALADMFRA